MVTDEDHSLFSLANWTAGRFHTAPVTCEMIPLDSPVEKRGLALPNFIKCDVEGAEFKVFQGAPQQNRRPLIMFEANVHTAKGFGRSVEGSREFLAALSEPGYHFFTSGNRKLMKVEHLDPVHSNVLIHKVHISLARGKAGGSGE